MSKTDVNQTAATTDLRKERMPARAATYVAIYPMLSQIANEHGYALCVHGSIHRDLDLVAVPWVETAGDPVELIKAMKAATETVTHCQEADYMFKDCNPTNRPHGRLSFSLHATNEGCFGGYFDVSVMPRIL